MDSIDRTGKHHGGGRARGTSSYDLLRFFFLVYADMSDPSAFFPQNGF